MNLIKKKKKKKNSKEKERVRERNKDIYYPLVRPNLAHETNEDK